MKEGKILLRFIDNQAISKKQIAEDVGMSRRNLYQLFESQTLTEDTKLKFEQYFDKEIFSKEAIEAIGKEAISNLLAEREQQYISFSNEQYIESLRAQIKILDNHNVFLQKMYEEKIAKIESDLQKILSLLKK